MAAQVAAGEMSQSDFDKTMEDVSKAESAISQIPEGLDIEATREAFDLLLEKDKLKTKDKILAAGSLRTEDGKVPGGSLLILDVETREEALALLHGDPATKAGLRGTISVRYWNRAILDGVAVD